MNFETENYLDHFFVSGILPDHNYRFVLGRNTSVVREISNMQGASSELSGLLGEAMLGAFFLSTHSAKSEKQTISLHLECAPPVHRLIAFASSDGSMRGSVAHPHARFEKDSHIHLKGGILRVNRWVENLWIEKKSNIYSSAIEMRDAPLFKNLEEFVGRSEQIQTFLHIQNTFQSGEDDSGHVSGYLFQALPGASADDTDAVLDMLDGKTSDELINQFARTGPGSYHDLSKTGGMLKTKIQKTGPFFFRCDCSREKIEKVILSMGESDAQNLIEEEGQIQVLCEFCKTSYEFSADQVHSLFRGSHL